jgi:flavin reductase (DIM6/NTAB) family NADH-FMN oxidoreductase RutF
MGRFLYKFLYKLLLLNNMSELTGPRQTILVTCRHEGKDNVITLAWHSPLSFYPELYGIVVGKTRYSYEMIKKSGVFCVNFVPASMEEQIKFCGEHSGKRIDKFKECKLTKEECEKIDCPRIKEAIGFMECKVTNTFECGDHVIFVGKVLKSELLRKEKRLYHIGGHEFVTTSE